MYSRLIIPVLIKDVFVGWLVLIVDEFELIILVLIFPFSLSKTGHRVMANGPVGLELWCYSFPH